MRKIIKYLTSLFLIPLVRFYLRKERRYTYQGTTVKVFPGVFHPGFFYSTKFIIDYLSEKQLSGKLLLELGCGTGLISVIAAKSGAHVVASDLSLLAVENTKHNAFQNSVSVNIIHSDLFDSIGEMTFDWIIINPPYYARSAKNEEELAWNCGTNFEYYQKLFSSLNTHIHESTSVIMVLTKGSELEKIVAIATRNSFILELIKEKKVFFDGRDFLFRIKRVSP